MTSPSYVVSSRRAWSAAGLMLVIGLVTGAAAMYPYARQSRAAPVPAATAVATTRELMTALLDPAADQVWGAIAVIETAAGVEERQPRTDAEWAAVRTQALLVAEGGRLLMTSGHSRDGDGWSMSARRLVETSVAAVRATERHEPQALLDAGEQIYAACVQCHSSYWPSGPSAAPPVPAR